MRYNIQEVKDNLSISDIQLLLKELGASHIPDLNNRGELITNTICHNVSGGSHKLYYSDEHKSFRCFTGCSENFDIFELVSRVFTLQGNETRFPQAVEWVANKTNQSTGFGVGFGFAPKQKKINEDVEWLNRLSQEKIQYPEPVVYPKAILDVFPTYYHQDWLNDNISVDAMKRHNIKFSTVDNAIIVPHYNIDGDLIGIMQRNMSEAQLNYKYIPSTVQGVMYNHIKSLNLYGLSENIEAIKRLGKVIIYESEKAVLQTFKYFGDNCYAVALSGSNMSQYQIDLLLGIDELREVQIALDKEYDDDDEIAMERQRQHIDRIGKKFAPYVKVTVLFDREGLLEKQDSPSDKGKEVLLQLLSKKVEVLNVFE